MLQINTDWASALSAGAELPKPALSAAQGLHEASFDGREVHCALAHVLASPEFCKAQRTSRLLRFLVEKALTGKVKEIKEYAIGIDVFDRSASTYDTSSDPIVRVQVGRLREKLKAYYALHNTCPGWIFSIPLGSYMPLIEKASAQSQPLQPSFLLSVVPLLHWSKDPQGADFTGGLNEELSCQLFKAFSQKIVSPTFFGGHVALSPSGLHRLEGSIRINGDLIRVSLRLIKVANDAIVWSEQLDRYEAFSIVVQDELAATICRALQGYFSSLG